MTVFVCTEGLFGLIKETTELMQRDFWVQPTVFRFTIIGSSLQKPFLGLEVADINLGSGLLFQYAIGIERILSPKSNVYVHFGKVNPLEGNFTPYSLDFGFKFQLHQLLKK